MHSKLVLSYVLISSIASAQKLTIPQLIEASRKDPAEFRIALNKTLGAASIQKGEAVLGEGPDFVFAVESARRPQLFIDGAAATGGMRQVTGSNVWVQVAKLQTGTSHGFYWKIDGKQVGGKMDVAAFGPMSYDRPGVPKGKLSDKMVYTSKLYDGMQSDYWVYVPAQYDPSKPAALMVWQDGKGLTQREGSRRAQIVFDNLTHDGKIPVMIHVFIDPGLIGKRKMRSIEYDTMNDKYARFLRDEILTGVQQKYNIRKDGYSRAIAGNSSGGICAFNVAWQQPDQFSRVLSRVGSFTSIQWHPGEIDGGNVFPFKIRKEAKRNIRVWLQDGFNDLENDHGSWPLQNLQMANSLKMRGYDFHLSFGTGSHNGAHGSAELPEEMMWLWRDYDPAKTSQVYEMEAAEKEKPMFRVQVVNR